MTDERTFTARVHTLSGELLTMPLSTLDGHFPEIIQGTAFPDDSPESDATFFLGRHQHHGGDTADYYLENKDPAGRSLWRRLVSRRSKT